MKEKQDVPIIGALAIPVEDTAVLSKCEICGTITPFDQLIKIWRNGVRWDVCSYECAEGIGQQ